MRLSVGPHSCATIPERLILAVSCSTQAPGEAPGLSGCQQKICEKFQLRIAERNGRH